MAIPDTSVSLLHHLKDWENHEAWERFAEIYAPLLYGFGRRRGIPSDDAEDFAQDVLFQVSRSIGRLDYDSAKGSFRSWLFLIAKRVLINRFRAQGRRPSGTGSSEAWREAEHALADESEERLRNAWEREYRRQLFSRAAERIESATEPEIWASFWRTAVLGESGESVAQDLGVTLGTLYTRRSRLLSRIRETVAEIAAEWDSVETHRRAQP